MVAKEILVTLNTMAVNVYNDKGGLRHRDKPSDQRGQRDWRKKRIFLGGGRGGFKFQLHAAGEQEGMLLAYERDSEEITIRVNGMLLAEIV